MKTTGKQGVIARMARPSMPFAALLLTFLAVAVPGNVHAQPNAAGSQPRPEDPKTAARPQAAPRGPQEGIKIHGHWIIDVKSADGKIVEHRDFENSLTAQGAVTLGNILLGVQTPLAWNVALGGTIPSQSPASQANPCGSGAFTVSNNNVNVSGSGFCILSEAGANIPLVPCTTAGVFCTLVRVPALGTVVPYTATGFSLQGTFTAPAGGYVGTVTTQLIVCASAAQFGTNPTSNVGLSSSSPASCFASNVPGQEQSYPYFTATQVNPPVQVQPGQAVSTTVQFTFQ